MPHRTFKDVLPCSCACTWHITHCHFEQLHLWLGLNDEDLIIINNNNNNGFVAPLGPKIQRRLMQHRTKWVWIDRFSSGVWKWECFRTVECQQVESSRWMEQQQKKRDDKWLFRSSVSFSSVQQSSDSVSALRCILRADGVDYTRLVCTFLECDCYCRKQSIET